MRRNLLAGLAALAAALSAVLTFAVPAATAASVAAPASASTLLLQFNGVSCVSAKFCAGVGAQGDSAHPAKGNVPLAMIWTGTRWRKTAVPLSKNWSEGQLDSVSCRSAAYCVATGEEGGGADTPIAETWNGRAWTVAKLPRPDTGAYFPGIAVSCASVRRCVATGANVTKSRAGRPFIDTLSGTKWATRSVPLPSGTKAAGLGAVDCVSTSYCVLAGVYSAKHLAVLFESWNGKTFKVLTAASPAGSFFDVTGLSCVSSMDCVAVGQIIRSGLFSAGSVTAFAERWNGKAWSVTSVFGPKGPTNPELSAVSCTSPTRCVTVGLTTTNGTEQTSHALAAAYNGKIWTPASVPAPAGGGTSAFSTVSCLSASYCVAGGEGGGPGGLLFSSAAFTGFWNGKTWTEVPAA